jgi:YhcH/YjgK/YiaL family protein
MIFDQLIHSDVYATVAHRMRDAFNFLNRPDTQSLAPGNYPIIDDDVYAIVQEYRTNPPAEVKWEAHRRYIDVQYIAAGTERMGYGPISDFEVTKDYDDANDYLLLSGNGLEIVMVPGTFAIFFPHDVHRPTMAVDQPTAVRKVVVKVRV